MGPLWTFGPNRAICCGPKYWGRVIHRCSKFGASSEPRRDQAAPVGAFELPHLRRRFPWGYLGGSRSDNGDSGAREIDAIHVSRIAYKGTNEPTDSDPIVAPTGIKIVDKSAWGIWKSGLCLLAMAGGCWRGNRLAGHVAPCDFHLLRY